MCLFFLNLSLKRHMVFMLLLWYLCFILIITTDVPWSFGLLGVQANFEANASSLDRMEPADVLLPLLKNRRKYNYFLAPGQTIGKTTNVRVALYIESMSSFKAATMDFEVDMYLAMSWVDHRLAHNCTHPVLINNLMLSEQIWHPDLYFVNSKFAYLQKVTTPNFMMLIYPDGMVFKSMRVDVTLSCMMDLARFPMDTQHCNMIIQSYAYVQNILNLTWHVDVDAGFPISNNPDIKLNDMTVTNRSWDYCSNVYPMFRGSGLWSCLNGTITMTRHVMFHIIQTYVPTSMLVWLSWLSFWLDPKAAPARISLTITTLLTLTTMSNGARNDLPQVSYIKALDVWLSVCTAFVFCVLLEYTMVSVYVTRKTSHCIHSTLVAAQQLADQPEEDNSYEVHPIHLDDCHRFSSHYHGHVCSDSCIRLGHLQSGAPLLPPNSQKEYEVPKRGRYRNELPSRPCVICSAKWERVARRIDKASRIGFPTTFFLFVALYWLLYRVF